MSLRIAVLGTTGLIGHAIAQKLRANGHVVMEAGRKPDAQIHVDLSNPRVIAPRALSGCDVLVHAAGVTDEDFGDRESAFAKAIRGTTALLAVARASGVRKLVYFSSAHVYGPLEGRIDEANPPNPLSDYAIAHFAAEQIFRRAAMEADTSALVVRPCAVYGMPPSLERFARWSLIPYDFPRQAVTGRIVLKSHGHQRRNFVPAEGLGHLVGWWLGQPAPGTTVANAPGRAECPVYEFASLCARIAKEECGKEPAIERPPAHAAPPEPLEYRTRVGGHLPGPSLEDHVRGLIRALSVKVPS